MIYEDILNTVMYNADDRPRGRLYRKRCYVNRAMVMAAKKGYTEIVKLCKGTSYVVCSSCRSCGDCKMYAWNGVVE